MKENGYQPKEQLSKTARQEVGKKRHRNKPGRGRCVKKQWRKSVTDAGTSQIDLKTADRSEKTIKTAHQAGQTVKSSGKGTIKVSGRTVKTAERTVKAAVRATKAAA